MKRTKAHIQDRFILLFLLLLAMNQTMHGQEKTTSATEEIPTVAFCEMVKNPKLYFDKTVRLTAIYKMATEAQYLSDENCPLSHDDQIGIRYADINEQQRELLRREFAKFRSNEYGGQARVTIVGILRNKSRRDFAWYRYRFDIISLEKISHLVSTYQGELQGGTTYRAAVRGDKNSGLALVTPVRMPEHHAVHIEWTNLSEFPALEKLRHSSREQQIVFSVIFDERKQMTVQRWNRTIKVKIIRIE